MNELLLPLLLWFLPFLSALPAWQRMRREARNARYLATDLDVLLRDGDRERALSVIEQGTTCLSSTLRRAIQTTERPALPLECRVEMPVAAAAARWFSAGGRFVLLLSLFTACGHPVVFMFFLFVGGSMLAAGAMLKAARIEIEEAHVALLHTVRLATW